MQIERFWRDFSWGFLALIVATTAMATPSLQTTRLKNGLQVLVQEDHRAPVVSFQLWYHVGSSYEPKGITGIAHAFEHMMFKGTKKHPGDEFSRRVAQAGGQENAMTSRDYTVYFQTLPAKSLPLSFEMESDRMQHLVLGEGDFAHEIEVVQEERRLRVDDKPQSATYEKFAAAAFRDSTYHHMTIGWSHDLKQMRVDELRQWYQQWYAPNNATIVVVGDVKPKAVFALAKQYFSQIPHRDLPKVPATREKPQKQRREIAVMRPAKLPWMVMGYRVPTLKTAENSWEPYALTVAAAILSGDSSARLPRDLMRGQGIATVASAGYDPFDRLDTLFELSGTPVQGKDSKQLEKALLKEVKKLQDEPVKAAELERVKTQTIASHIYAKDERFYQGLLLGRLSAVGLPVQIASDYVQHIQSVTAEQVQAVAKRYFRLDHLTVAHLHPASLLHQSKGEK